MRVLITGGAGFIGSHVADRLLARNDSVLVLDNYATGRRENLPPSHARLEIVEGDIADAEVVDASFDRFRPDVVLHAAASYKDPEDWASDARTNVIGTAHVVKAAGRAGVSRLIYLQTALCYGLNPGRQPIKIDDPLDPRASSYAISKTAGESYVGLSSLNWISFRLANAYGPRNLSGPLPTFFARLTAGKPCFVMDTRRDFIFVRDLVDVIEKAVDGQGQSGPYHVSSGSDTPIRDLFEATVRQLGIELAAPVEVRPRGPDDAFSILLDPTETEREFVWRATTGLPEGVAETVDAYRATGVGETYTHLRLDNLRS